MIFKEEMIDKILVGEKTVTRRPVSYGWTHGSVQPKRIPLPCKYKPGRTYAVQPGRGKKAVGRILILDVQRGELRERPLGCGPIGGSQWTEAEARREGFATWEDLAEYWCCLYGSYDPTQLVNRIEFALLEHKALNRGAK